MKVNYDITPHNKAVELYNKFLLINPYEKNALLRRRIAKESALEAVSEILKYTDNYLDSDGFWGDVKATLLKI